MRLHISSILPVVLGLVVGSTACSADPCEDDYTPDYTIIVIANPAQLNLAVSESAVLSALVLDQCNRPHAAGAQVLFQARNGSEATGKFGGDSDREVTFLDTSGGATVTFQCTEVAEVLLIAQLQSGAHGAAGVRCIDDPPDEE